MVAAEIAVAGNEKLNERYELMRVLGRGNFGETFEALDLETNGRVAIKRLALSKVGDWRAVDLFEREVRVLRNLDHPSIPKYLDFFTTDEGVNLHLVQDLVEGESLASEVAAGRRYVEAEIRDIAERVLTTLIYLQELNPPVFHRDIKPGNLVRGADGQLFVVDFGSVRSELRSSGSLAGTVAGTFGYMAPEQLHGHADRATDLYGLGATLLHLLTHREPAEFPRQRLKVILDSNALSLSKPLTGWLAKLLEPAPEDRFPSAAAARTALDATANVRLAPVSRTLEPPIGSCLRGSRTETEIEVVIPGSPFAGSTLLQLGKGVFPLGFVAFVTWSTRTSVFFWALSLFFCVVAARELAKWLFAAFGTTRFVASADAFELSRSLFGVTWKRTGPTAQLDRAKVETRVVKNRRSSEEYSHVVLRQGALEHHFGQHLNRADQEWLAKVLNKFLRSIRALNAGPQRSRE